MDDRKAVAVFISNTRDINQRILVQVDCLKVPAYHRREKISDKDFEQLVTSLKEHGQVKPVVVREVGDKYNIIDGKQTWLALKTLGITSVWVEILPLETDKQEKLLHLRLNRVVAEFTIDNVFTEDFEDILALCGYVVKTETLPERNPKPEKGKGGKKGKDINPLTIRRINLSMSQAVYDTVVPIIEKLQNEYNEDFSKIIPKLYNDHESFKCDEECDSEPPFKFIPFDSSLFNNDQ